MAKILSSPWSIIRGSIAGTTYLANQFHQIVARARTAPVQPNTIYQTHIRSALNAASDVWANLTSAVRLQWEMYANGLEWPGPLGPYTCPGRQVFIAGRSLQEYVNTRGLAVPTMVTTAPSTMLGFYNLKNVGCSAPTTPGTGVAVSFTTETATDALVYAEISQAFSPARYRYKGPWESASAQASVVPMATSGLIEFLGLEDGAIYFIRLKAVADDAPPRVSCEYIVRCIGEVISP